MTPAKLAAFYHSVGGDYDVLFLNTPHPSLAFIYQSLGCSHSLQPTSDDFAPPSVPALTPRGFVRWQTIQLLLDPEEHVPYLQEAVASFDIKNPTTGALFPKDIPRKAFPMKPDENMTEWHNDVFERLKREAQDELEGSGKPEIGGNAPDGTTPPNFSDYFSAYESPRSRSSRSGRPPSTPYHGHGRRHRRQSEPEPHYAPDSYFPAAIPRPKDGEAHDSRPSGTSRRRGSPNSSIASDDEDDRSSVVLSDTSSNSPVRNRHDRRPHTAHIRRHSDEDLHDRRWHTRSDSASSDDDSPSPRLSSRLPAVYFQHPMGPPPRVNYRGANVRWANENSVYVFPQPSSAASTPGSELPPRNSRRLHDSHRADDRRPPAVVRPQIRRLVSPVMGVHGRRYPTDGMVWR